ncbi:MAG: response regulator [Deltaproteobacteria bacterium]|nr:response regulator [Deltaproteobacteria bacterium]MBW1816051.1 response regulator [Deltaproteobacteria bacterium]
MVDNINKQKILIIDDNPENIQILMEALKDDYKIVAAVNGEKALKMAEMVPLPDIILLDIMMPGMDGHEVCKRLKDNEKTSDIPVVFITALSEEEDEAKGLALGAVDYITKPINPELVKARVRNHLELKGYRDNLEKLVRERTREVMLTQAVMIESLATLAEYRDPETGGHIKRTQNYVKALAKHLKDHPRFRNELNDETIELLYISAPLHDIGKVGVQDHILMKPGKLTDEEFEIMKKHTKFGHDAIYITEQKLGKSSFLRFAREIASTHQEKWDGSGYPEGLKGDEIPISGRLMALADVYDALISKRVYKPPFPHEKAVEIIMEGKETHFDPDIVDAFIALESTFRNIALTFADFEEERQMLEGGKPIEAKDCKRIENILLVEDNEINLEIMQSQLLSLGYQVDTAINGKEALIKYQEKTYDIILTDLEMPEMDGYALAAEIRRIEENSKKPIPILAVTASDFDLTKERAISLGFNGYMLKPFEIDVLEKKLSSIVYDTSKSN